jgi:hypothetical protein
VQRSASSGDKRAGEKRSRDDDRRDRERDDKRVRDERDREEQKRRVWRDRNQQEEVRVCLHCAHAISLGTTTQRIREQERRVQVRASCVLNAFVV